MAAGGSHMAGPGWSATSASAPTLPPFSQPMDRQESLVLLQQGKIPSSIYSPLSVKQMILQHFHQS